MHSYKKVSGMTAEIKITRCYGCGALLQTLNRYEAGYVSPSRANSNENLCDRCYKLRHPNGDNFQTVNKDFTALIKTAIGEDALICYIIDAFFWKGSLSLGLNKLLQGGRVVVILNKIDILPDSISKEEIKEYVDADLKKNNIHPISYIYTSINDMKSIQALMSNLDTLRKGKDIYFIGTSRVGKSALINEFLKFYDNHTGRTITKENFGENDLSLTAIPLDEDTTLYDTPGVFESTTMVNQIERKALKYVVPRNKVIENSLSLKEGESLLLGGLAIIDYKSGNKADWKMYFSKDISVKKVKTTKALAEFNKSIEDNVAFPTSATIQKGENLVETELTLPKTEKEIVLSIYGLGKIKLLGQDQVLVFHLPKEVLISID